MVMYHYVKPRTDGMPFFAHLALDDFRRQLDWFADTSEFIDRERFLGVIDGGEFPDNAVVLTFDDGFRDHYDFVLPELESRGLWGIFYVPTGIYETKRLLDVHRVHCLLGRLGGARALARLQTLLTPEMLSAEYEKLFASLSYQLLDHDESTRRFKHVLNYLILDRYRAGVLDAMMADTFDETALVETFYMDPTMIADMQRRGMVVGSHSVTHPVFSKLAPDTQKIEIEASFRFLDDVTGGLSLRTFCYPYGLPHTYTADTQRLLCESGCRFSVSVDFRDVEAADVKVRVQALPRHDCNAFPHGRPTFGVGEA